MSSFPSVSIDNFLGLNTSSDELSVIPGQLILNENYLYMPNGGLEERGGGAKLSDAPSAGNPVFSLSNYINSAGTEFLIINQGTDAYYYSSGWNAMSLTLTSSLKTRWAQAGNGANTALYGVNGTDSVIKISGTTPTGTTVSDSPTTTSFIKLHKNRLFAAEASSSTLYFTEALGFDTWNTTANTIDVAPGVDGNITGLEVWGDALFIFKELGVYVLPNADSPVPKLNWVVLRTDAATGSNSPDSIRRTRAGIFYLSSDNFIRLLSPSISYSSGEYTLGGSGSPIISHHIQESLTMLLNDAAKGNAQAVVHNDLYVLSFETVNNSGSYNDQTFFADTAKFINIEGIAQPQPFWGVFTGFDYDFMVQQKSSGLLKIYGAKGASGEVHETLNVSINNDNSAAIESKAILGWYPVSGESLYKRFKQIIFVGETENWSIDLVFNAYSYGGAVPGEGEGSQYQTMPAVAGTSAVGTAVVGTDVVGELKLKSDVFRVGLKGNFFKAEMSNNGVDEPTKIQKIIIYFREIRNR